MSLRIVRLAEKIEHSDDFHLARLIILLNATKGKTGDKPIQGIMKLAKLDFLLRYPNCLARALQYLGRERDQESISVQESHTIEARMIRFRFGPWDKRYRRWIGLLTSRGLVEAFLEGRTVQVKLTQLGQDVANKLIIKPEFEALAKRSRIINTAVGNYSATNLKQFVYDVFPEIISLQWGENIDL